MIVVGGWSSTRLASDGNRPDTAVNRVWVSPSSVSISDVGIDAGLLRVSVVGVTTGRGPRTLALVGGGQDLFVADLAVDAVVEVARDVTRVVDGVHGVRAVREGPPRDEVRGHQPVGVGRGHQVVARVVALVGGLPQVVHALL